METKGHYFIVGLFVIVLLVSGLFFSIWLYDKTGKEGLPYTIFFKSSVNGLNPGSSVIYQGVPIGKVTSISVDSQESDQVRVDVSIQKDFTIYYDTYAQLEMKGITGGLLVQLKGGSKDTPKLLPSRKNPSPAISSRPSNIEELFTSAPKLVKNISDVAENLNEILNDKTKENVTGIISDVKDLTGAVARKTKSIEHFLDDAASLFDKGAKFIGNFDKEIGSVSKVFKDAMGVIKTASGKIGGFSDQATGLVKENRQGILDFTSTGLYEFSQLMNEMRDLVVGISRISKKIESSGLFSGNSGKGVEAK